MFWQKSLFKRKTAEQALELASWARVEINDLRLALKAEQAKLKKIENNLGKLEGLLSELKQGELFVE
ncbi:hypothetical protein AGMMS50268_37150 [Spirochaetia bacterium]|nr:hypothetical protein AGMMS50268_37150 [Spirochaetia bacterium]